MRNKHRFILIQIRNVGEVVRSNMFNISSIFFTDRSKLVLYFWNNFICISCLFACHAVFSVPCSHVDTCRERADLLALLYVMFLLRSHIVS